MGARTGFSGDLQSMARYDGMVSMRQDFSEKVPVMSD